MKDEGDVTSYYPPHAVRVSLITALATEGGMDLPLLVALVGHTRLVMTLYYNKPSAIHRMNEISRANEKLEQSRAESEANFLRNASVQELRDRAICNDVESILVAIKPELQDRNPAGWLEMLAGVCVMGGNTQADASNTRIGGCHNGGQLISDNKSFALRKFAMVEGGPRTCANCRWFATGPEYLPSLVASWNNLEFQRYELSTEAQKIEDELNVVLDEIYDKESSNAGVSKVAPLYEERRRLERRFEASIKKTHIATLTQANTYRLIRRCIEVEKLNFSTEVTSTALVANGGEEDLKMVIERTDSKLLQMSRVNADAQIYPDLDPGKAILLSSQMIDAKLMKEGAPPVMLQLSEEDQLRATNALLRKLASAFNSTDLHSGHRQVVACIESDQSIAKHLGFRREDFKAFIAEAVQKTKVIPVFQSQPMLPNQPNA